MECKFWIDIENYEITSELEYNLTPHAKREIKKIGTSISIISCLNGTYF